MRKVKISLSVIALLLLLAFIFSGEGEIDLSRRLFSPSAEYLFGTDSFGRSLLSRVSYALIVSLSIGIASSALSLALSLVISFVLVKAKSNITVLILSLLDSIKVIPTVILALFLASIKGPSALNVVVVLVLAFLPNCTRTTCATMKSIYKLSYIEAEYSIGSGEGRVFFFHVLRAMEAYIREEWISLLLSAVLIESSLSFLGAGVKATTPSLGAILQEGRPYILTSPHMVIIPSLVLIVISSMLLLLSDGLSELDSSSHRT